MESPMLLKSQFGMLFGSHISLSDCDKLEGFIKSNLSGFNLVSSRFFRPDDTEAVPADFPLYDIHFKQFKVTISTSRIDIFSQSIFDKLDIIEKIFLECLNYTSVYRLAVLADYFIIDDSYDFEELLSNDLELGFKEINLRVNKPISTEKFIYNNIEFISKGNISRKNEDGESETEVGILIQRDVNTDKNEKYIFDEKMFNLFTKEAVHIINQFILIKS